MKTFFKQYFFLLDTQAKKKLPILSMFFVVSAFLDVLSVGMVAAFLLLSINVHAVLHHFPAFIQRYLGRYSDYTIITTAGIIIIVSFMLKTMIGIYIQRRIVLFSSQLSVRLKTKLVFAYQNASYTHHLRQSSAHFLNMTTQSDVFIDGVVMPSLTLFSNALIVFTILSMLFILHAVVTVFLVVMFTAIILFHNLIVKKKIVQAGKTIAGAGRVINKSVLQTLIGLKEIRVFGKEHFFLDRLTAASLNYAAARALFSSMQQIPRYTIESGIGIFLVVFMLAALWSGSNVMALIPTLGIFAAACARLLPTLNQLVYAYNSLISSAPSMTVLHNEFCALEHCNEHFCTKEENKKQMLFSSFMLNNISFAYPSVQKQVLTNVSLVITRGHSVGFIGQSGAGKSTLINIILGILTPSEGDIRVDGQLVQNKNAWLNNFSYIPQNIFLLDDTLQRNIAFGISDADIDMQKLANAIEMAQLSSVVADLPVGVETMIGENGVCLSGGQRQRVALARALYHEREIIVMDEATSALDNETEHEVIDAIKRLQGVKTLIVIAHRLTTIQYCDVIYKLEKGMIVASGSFDEVVGVDEREKYNDLVRN